MIQFAISFVYGCIYVADYAETGIYIIKGSQMSGGVFKTHRIEDRISRTKAYVVLTSTLLLSSTQKAYSIS